MKKILQGLAMAAPVAVFFYFYGTGQLDGTWLGAAYSMFALIIGWPCLYVAEATGMGPVVFILWLYIYALLVVPGTGYLVMMAAGYIRRKKAATPRVRRAT